MTLHYWQSLDNLENCLYNLYDNAFKIPQLYFVYVSGETNIRVSNGLIESFCKIAGWIGCLCISARLISCNVVVVVEFSYLFWMYLFFSSFLQHVNNVKQPCPLQMYLPWYKQYSKITGQHPKSLINTCENTDKITWFDLMDPFILIVNMMLSSSFPSRNT